MKALTYLHSLLAFNQYLFTHSFKSLHGFTTATHHSLSCSFSWSPETGSVVAGSDVLPCKSPQNFSHVKSGDSIPTGRYNLALQLLFLSEPASELLVTALLGGLVYTYFYFSYLFIYLLSKAFKAQRAR